MKNEGITVVRQVLASLMLRRTKDTIDTETGECIVTLPPRAVHYIYIDLSPVERSFYAALAKRSSSQMLGIVAKQQQLTARQGGVAGKHKSALTGYAELFTLLMRLRQTCDHPVLVLQSLLEKQSLQSLISGQKLPQTQSQSEGGGVESICDHNDASDCSVGSNSDGQRQCQSQCQKQGDKVGALDRIKHKLMGSQREGEREIGPGCANTSNVFLNDVLRSLERSWEVRGEADPTAKSSSSSSDRDRSGDVNTSNSTPPPVPIEQQECCVCFEFMASLDHTALTPCGHVLCWSCATMTVQRTGACPLCLRPMSLQELIPLGDKDKVKEDMEDKREERGEKGKGRMHSFFSNIKTRNSSAGGARDLGSTASHFLEGINWQTSSKLLALQRELEAIFAAHPSLPQPLPIFKSQQTHQDQPNPKVVIFSQWTGMLDLVETMIQTNLVQRQTQTQKPTHQRTQQETPDAVVTTDDNEESHFTTTTTTTTTSPANECGSGGRQPKGGTVSSYFSAVSSRQDDDEEESADQYRFGLRPDCSVRFDGSMSQARRAQALQRFSCDPHARLLLISLKAGGVGLNLTAASFLFLLDPWWNPAVEDQAIDRVHRLGQMHTVKIMRMVCRDTVEEKLIALQARKRRMSQQALGGSAGGGADKGSTEEGGGANKLSLEELKGLFL